MQQQNFLTATGTLQFVTKHTEISLQWCYLQNLQTFNTVLSFLTIISNNGRQEGHPACKKTEWWEFQNYAMVMCLGQGADLYGPADATATLAPLNPDWFCLPGCVFYLSGAGSPG